MDCARKSSTPRSSSGSAYVRQTAFCMMMLEILGGINYLDLVSGFSRSFVTPRGRTALAHPQSLSSPAFQPSLLHPTAALFFEAAAWAPTGSSTYSGTASMALGAIKDSDDVNASDDQGEADRLVSDTPLEERGIGVGIDLGTTNSAVAVLISNAKPGEQDQLQGTANDGLYSATPSLLDIGHSRTMPSVVTLLGNSTDESPDENWLNGGSGRFEQRILVGKEAATAEQIYPQCSYRHVKRILGTGGRHAKQNAALVPNLLLSGLGDVTIKSKTFKKGKHNKSTKPSSEAAPVPLTQQLSEAQKYPAMLSWQPTTTNQLTSDDENEEKDLHADKSETAITSAAIDPEIVSACILRHLFDVAEQHAQQEASPSYANTIAKVTRAVVGVPAYFNDSQREATIRACAMAGVPKVRLLKEPEAAALAYGLGKDQISSSSSSKSKPEEDFEDELVLVFDLGGGTFDVSVLAVGGGIMEVVATSGNTMLGGTDFDHRIMDWIVDQVKFKRKPNSAVQDAVLRSAEAIRIYLSNAKRVMLSLPVTPEEWLSLSNPKDVIVVAKKGEDASDENEDEDDNSRLTVELSRREMEGMCLEEFQELLKPVREVAILAGALLPGDSRPQVAEAAIQMEQEFQQQQAQRAASVEFDDFFSSEDDEDTDAVTASSSAPSSLLQTADDKIDLKALRKQQQSSRRKARDLATREKTFRGETQKATNRAKKSLFRNPTKGGGNVKVQDSISGRPLSQVVLVGGATRMPAIGRMLTILTGVTPKRTVNPDEAVALGAAIQVGILDGDERLSNLQVFSPMKAAMMRALAQQQQKKEQQQSK
jgi:molecular chaperone DnaK (HSP70)